LGHHAGRAGQHALVVEHSDVLVDVIAHDGNLSAPAGKGAGVVCRVGVGAHVVALGPGQGRAVVEPGRVVGEVGIGRLKARHQVHAQNRALGVVVVQVLEPRLFAGVAGQARAEAVDDLAPPGGARVDAHRLSAPDGGSQR
jgi:hypothetical protein